ncbi:hypothetical protein ACF068_19775 [Streptomyces sp. NPDC016309]|uniref:hypothetical protein n=1 Tax=Streptomyces sp. NPDC016309 TaxID=3364965 RepID=UPI0037029AC2
MGTLIVVALIIAMIGVGVIVIHLLNTQHDERIAAFRYSDALPGIGRRGGRERSGLRAGRTDRTRPEKSPMPETSHRT